MDANLTGAGGPKTVWMRAVVTVILALLGTLTACGDSSPKLPSDASPDAVHDLITGPGGETAVNEFQREFSAAAQK